MWHRRRSTESTELSKIKTDVEDAEQALLLVMSRRPEIDEISSAARERLQRNHFGEALENSMKRR